MKKKEKKKKIGEPKKTTGRDNGWSNVKSDSQILNEKQKKKKKITGSETVEFLS
jgi:hypothetical protein